MPPVAIVPVVGPSLHVETGHFLTESVVGILVGAGLVITYLVVLRWLGGREEGRVAERRDKPGSEG